MLPSATCSRRSHRFRALPIGHLRRQRAIFSVLHALRSATTNAGDEWFRSAIELLGRLGITERLRACATEYAELLLARGRLEESIAYWRIAANASELSMMKSPVEPAGLTSET